MATTTPSLADVIDTGVSPWSRNVSNIINKTGSDVIADALRADGCLVINSSGQSPLHNPEDLVTRETYEEFNKIVNVYFLTFLVLVSVPTNLINMAVFFRHGLRQRINVCLFWLSFCDLVTVLGHFEWNLDGLVAAATGQPNQMVVMKANVNNMVHCLAGFIYVSGFMSTLIALERCVCVVFPFRFKQLMRTRTTVIIVVIGTLLIFGGHVVIATRWKVVCVFDPSTQRTMLRFSSSQFYLRHQALVDLFEGILFGVFLPGVYAVVVTVATAVTVCKLRQKPVNLSLSSNNNKNNNNNNNINNSSNNSPTTNSNSSNNNNSSSSPTIATNINSNTINKSDAKERTMTRMLIGASCLFVVCTVPPLVFHSLIPFVPDLSLSGKYYNTYLLCISVQQLLTYINASINFFFYAFLGSRYRATVTSMFLCRRVKARIAGLRGGEEAAAGSCASSSKMSTTATASHDSETIPKVAEAGWSMSFSAP